MDAPAETIDERGAAGAGAVRGGVRFENVRFAYPGGDAVLNGLNLTAEPGRMTAIVGPSGAGKSTVFNLLLRLYEPHAGRILLDGQPISDLSLARLRGSMALVSQDAFLFDVSVRENIALGRRGASEAEIREAAEAAACDFIASLPQGWETRVGEGGRLLSGGQRQRIALARALLSGAPVLLLDEATSALDSDSESRIQTALDRLSGSRTVIVIAHRLATVRRADAIVVIDGGLALETGRHEELIDAQGAYARLASLQLS
jgi:ABC-type multidrug transport system fused ATPase/permease subunit